MAAGDQLEAFKLIMEAIEKQDPQIIEKANKDLDLAKELIAQWRSDLDELCKTHDVVVGE